MDFVRPRDSSAFSISVIFNLYFRGDSQTLFFCIPQYIHVFPERPHQRLPSVQQKKEQLLSSGSSSSSCHTSYSWALNHYTFIRKQTQTHPHYIHWTRTRTHKQISCRFCLPANRATLACLASYGQRAMPLISSLMASKLSICGKGEKGERSTPPTQQSSTPTAITH